MSLKAVFTVEWVYQYGGDAVQVVGVVPEGVTAEIEVGQLLAVEVKGTNVYRCFKVEGVQDADAKDRQFPGRAMALRLSGAGVTSLQFETVLFDGVPQLIGG